MINVNDKICIDGKTVKVTAVHRNTDQIVVKWPTGEQTYRRLSDFEETK